jgi:hypothetical protein
MTKRRFVGKGYILNFERNLTPIPQLSTSQTNNYTDRIIQAAIMHIASSYTYWFTASIMTSCTPASQNILTYHNNLQIFKNKESE